MKVLITAIFVISVSSLFAQRGQCSCDNNQGMKGLIKCDTTILMNASKLYWQFNCDSVWLTLENTNREKVSIDEVPIEKSQYTYRLGYHLIKEFNKTLLFRSGCPATGPCVYTLVDKFNGNKLKVLPQLICINTDIDIDNPKKYEFDFVVYLAENYENLILYYVDKGTSCTIPMNEKLTYIVPEFQFTSMNITDNILTIAYFIDGGLEKNISVNLDDTKNCR